MLRLDRIVASLSVWLLLFCAHAASQTNAPHLKDGDTMPSLAGQTLSGKWIESPSAFCPLSRPIQANSARLGTNQNEHNFFNNLLH
jgi:hypothetical protein